MLRYFKHNFFLLVVLLTIVGGTLRFYNLNWGAPYYFHPDERNIASSVSQLHFPNMHPHFFAYGSLPIYFIYFTGILANIISSFQLSPFNFQLSTPFTVPFEQAILISRVYSAIFSTLLIPLIYIIGKRITDKKTGLIAAFLTTCSVGLSQYAHFGTFELWLTFFSTLLFICCINIFSQKHFSWFFLASIVAGLLVSIKISSVVLLPLPILCILIKTINHRLQIAKQILQIIIIGAGTALFTSGVCAIIFFATNPYVILDFQAFKGTITYESTLAIGTLPVFYSSEFFDSIPVLFQFQNVYPFLLNPTLTLLFVFAFLYLTIYALKSKNKYYLLLVICYLLLFLSQAFLFVKWVRYIVPTLPFMYLIIAVVTGEVLTKIHLKPSRLRLAYGGIGILLAVSILFALSYVKTVLLSKDTRVTAAEFAEKNISDNAVILSEVYDLGIVAFHKAVPYTNITLFNFYDLDQNSPEYTPQALLERLEKSGYIILPSQRILKTRLMHAKRFPLASKFYNELFSGKLGYEKIYETPCDMFCKILYFGDPVWNSEQTVTVFDRPVVYIFKKTPL